MPPQTRTSQNKQLAQVMLATLLVAGTPVAAVWALRFSGTVDSVALTLMAGVVLSLLTSWAGRVVWERRQGSEDLLFNELMIWGYLHRRRSQRRLADTADLAAPLQAKAAGDSRVLRDQRQLLERLVAGMETRDPYLHGHSRRVARHSWMIARRMGLDATEVARIRTAAALHDVGKTKTPKTILHKAGALTDEEYRVIKLHPGEGADMAAVLGDAELGAMIRHHHERLDGSGYPDGLKGEQILLGARIIAVADTFDAITSARPYRGASPHRKAIDILHEEAGTKLDPEVVRAFCGHYAGRGPLAIWSFVCSLPERMLSWLTASAGTVASAAKVAAVAALVGASAATSATLGIANAARPGHAHESATAAIVSATPAGAIAALAGQGSAASEGATQGREGQARRLHAHAPGSSQSSSPAAGGSVPVTATGVPAPAAGQGAGGGSQTGGHGESSPGAHEEAPRAEQPHESSGSEAPKAKHEEAPAKGKGEEAPAKGKSEGSSGKPEEGGGSAKHEEASGGGSGGGSEKSGGGSESPGGGNPGSGSSGGGSEESGGGSSGKGAVKSESGGKGPSGE